MSFISSPAYRSQNNTRPGIVVETPQSQSQSQAQEQERAHLTSLLSSSQDKTSDLPLCLQVSRATPTTILLSNFRTNEVLYAIVDTGRRSLSRKPDYEVWRGSSADSGLFVGSIRIGKTGVEVKLPAAGREFEEVEEWDLGGDGSKRGKWELETFRGKRWWDVVKGKTESKEEVTDEKVMAVLECSDKASRERICSVRLVDVFPNGSFLVWDQRANVDAGGDWGFLDEIVTVSYVNMEKARRRCMTGPSDPNSWMGLAFMPTMMGPSFSG